MKHTTGSGQKSKAKQTGKAQHKNSGKLIYLLALLPVLSTGLYLLLMSVGQTENFAVLGILVFLVAIAIWGICGALFARSGIPFIKSALIGNAFPILCGVVYTILYVIATFAESEAILNVAEIIGGLGTGMFGIFGTLLYMVIPLSLFEVYINLVFCLLVFGIGYAIGISGRAKKKPLGSR